MHRTGEGSTSGCVCVRMAYRVVSPCHIASMHGNVSADVGRGIRVDDAPDHTPHGLGVDLNRAALHDRGLGRGSSPTPNRFFEL